MVPFAIAGGRLTGLIRPFEVWLSVDLWILESVVIWVAPAVPAFFGFIGIFQGGVLRQVLCQCQVLAVMLPSRLCYRCVSVAPHIGVQQHNLRLRLNTIHKLPCVAF
jgi:hypothetical protein